MEILEKVTVWFSIRNGGDGSAYPAWFITKEKAEEDQEKMFEGCAETCTGSIETFKGSDVHCEAVANENEEDIDKITDAIIEEESYRLRRIIKDYIINPKNDFYNLESMKLSYLKND